MIELLTGDPSALKAITSLGEKITKDAANKYGVTDIEAFNKYRQ